MSLTPLDVALNAFTLALKDSAEAFVDLLIKKLTIAKRCASIDLATILKASDQLNSTFNIDMIDFNGQFFQKEDVMAFRPTIMRLDTLEVLEERQRGQEQVIHFE